MFIYAIYERSDGSSHKGDDVVAVKEAFHFLAFGFPILWMLYHRMFLFILVYFLVGALWDRAVDMLSLPYYIWGVWGHLVLSFTFGFSAPQLRQIYLENKGYTLGGVAWGSSALKAELLHIFRKQQQLLANTDKLAQEEAAGQLS